MGPPQDEQRETFRNGGQSTAIAKPAATDIPEPAWRQAAELRRSEKALADPRTFAPFLTGLTSPGLTRRKLGGHLLFGCLADVPFAEVLRKAEAS